jgi:galactokinase
LARADTIVERFRRHFGEIPAAVASAPGRVNLVGEHTDYNDGFVLPMAIDRRTFVAVSLRRDDRVDVVSTEGANGERYVNAIVLALRMMGIAVVGANVVVSGDVPIGAGLSSSAALELAAARAICELTAVSWDAMAMAQLAQRAENDHVGVRCGIMDQVASSAGRRGHALLLDCRSLDRTFVELPAEVSVVVMDTGVRRALADTEYNNRRSACEEAVKVIREIAPGVRALRDVTPEMLANAATRLDPVVLRRARHVVLENARPPALLEALRARNLAAAGALMNDSHSSLRDLYEVSSQHLDIVCEVARAHGSCRGARMTGAGFGGCAIALVDADGVDDFIRTVQPRYESRTYMRSAFFVVAADDGARLERFQNA